MYTYPDENDRLTIDLIEKYSLPAYWEESEREVLKCVRCCAESIAESDSAFASSPITFLDLGCGTGRLIPFFTQLAQSVTAVEPDASRFAEAEKVAARMKSEYPDKTINMIHGDITSLLPGGLTSPPKRDSDGAKATDTGSVGACSAGSDLTDARSVVTGSAGERSADTDLTGTRSADSAVNMTFSCAMSSHVLQHIPEETIHTIFSGLSTLVKTSGYLFITTTLSGCGENEYSREYFRDGKRISEKISKREFENSFGIGSILPVAFYTQDFVKSIAAGYGFSPVCVRGYHFTPDGAPGDIPGNAKESAPGDAPDVAQSGQSADGTADDAYGSAPGGEHMIFSVQTDIEKNEANDLSGARDILYVFKRLP